jgi:hypothetical protein
LELLGGHFSRMLIMPPRDEFLFYSERELDVELDVIGQP